MMTQTTERSHELIEKMIDSLKVDAVFGAPIRQGDVTLIPVSRVWYGFGEGSGYGRADAPPEGEQPEGEQRQAAEGAGEGGGGGGSVRPMGYLRIADGQVSYEPIMDNGRLALAALTMIAWNVFWIGATLRAFARRR
jgi:uncharacterized spore protein YtfJ